MIASSRSFVAEPASRLGVLGDADPGGDAMADPPTPESQVELRCLKAARREAIDRFEVEYIRALLKRAGGNVTRAAALAEVSRQVIHKLIARHRL